MRRTALKDRQLPDYTREEERFNMISHIIGALFGVYALINCLIKSNMNQNIYQTIASIVFGLSLIVLYSVSSIYHGLILEKPKKVMQIIDHCTIFVLIAGTYTPITLCSLREYNQMLGWAVFTIGWGISIIGIILNAIDLRKYKKLSLACYLIQGWCIIFTGIDAIKAIGINGFMWLVIGGLFYSIGALLYAIASNRIHRYMHSIFHIFVVLGSIMHFICIINFVLI